MDELNQFQNQNQPEPAPLGQAQPQSNIQDIKAVDYTAQNQPVSPVAPSTPEPQPQYQQPEPAYQAPAQNFSVETQTQSVDTNQVFSQNALPEQAASNNKRFMMWIIIGVVAILVIVLGIFVWKWSQNSNEEAPAAAPVSENQQPAAQMAAVSSTPQISKQEASLNSLSALESELNASDTQAFQNEVNSGVSDLSKSF